MAIELPKTKLPAITQDPRQLIIFSKFKVGKTTALAELPNNLIIDTEEGSDYVSAMKVKISSIKDINEVCKAIKDAGDPYDFITVDTTTTLEEICKPLALKLYQNTVAGAGYEGDVLNAPNGSGYGHLRDAILMVIEKIKERTRNIILVCHSKDAAIDKNELTVKQIDLLGKTGRILSSKADAIGYLYRDDASNTILSFNTNNKFIECGARPEHLKNADIVLGEMGEDNNLTFYWERIYPSLKNNA